MELVEAMQKRRSVRRFQDRPVPDLGEIIRLAQTGPSAGGIRGWEVVQTAEQVGPYAAPAYLVVCVNQGTYQQRYGDRGYDLYALQDAAIVGAYLQLLLVDQGLASCWVGAFNEVKVRRALGLQWRPVILLAVGYEA